MSIVGFFGVVCGLLVPLICVVGSIVLLIIKIVERKEKRKSK